MACGEIENPWGLVIIASAFWIQFVSFGMADSFGVYIVELLRHFDVSLPFISLIGSVNVGLCLGAGPLASVLMRKMSYRRVCFLGAILSTTGLIVLPFTMNMVFLLFFYGIVTGIGYCLLYVPSHTMSGLYYDKHRSLATGVATAGSGLGGIVFPNLVQYLIDEYGWRGSLLLVAGINMNTFIFSALLRDSPMQKAHRAKENLIRDVDESELAIDSSEGKVLMANSRNTNGKAETNGEVEISDDSTNENINSNSIWSVMLALWKNIPFCIYVVNNVLWNSGTAIPFILGPEYFTTIGFSQTESATLISLFSGGSFVGCVLGGVIGNIAHINRLYLYIFVNLGVGAIGFLIPLDITHSMVGLAIVGIVWGTMYGLLLGLLVVVTADLVGIQYLGDAMGFLMLANGIGYITGPPIGALAVIASGLIMAFIPISLKVCKTPREKDRELTLDVT